MARLFLAVCPVYDFWPRLEGLYSETELLLESGVLFEVSGRRCVGVYFPLFSILSASSLLLWEIDPEFALALLTEAAAWVLPSPEEMPSMIVFVVGIGGSCR